jgi:hypothetical protein
VFSAKTMSDLRLPTKEEQFPDSPAGMLQVWRMMEFEGLQAGPAQLIEPLHRAREVVVWWRVVSYLVAGLGLVILTAAYAALLMRRSRQAAPKQLTPTA